MISKINGWIKYIKGFIAAAATMDEETFQAYKKQKREEKGNGDNRKNCSLPF